MAYTTPNTREEATEDYTFEPINLSLSSEEHTEVSEAQVVDLDRIFEHRNAPPRRRPVPLKSGVQVYLPSQGQVIPAVYATAGYVPM